MRMLTAGLMAMAGLAAAGPARDPFVGKWKLDVSRSLIVDSMVVEAGAGNRYTFRFEGAPAETVVADGSEQPGLPGTTLAVKAGEGGTLKVVRRQAGRVTVSASWRLSDHDRILRDTFTALQSDGTTVAVDYVYRRMSAGQGFAGAWESTTPPTGLNSELEIRPYGGAGLAFVAPGVVKSVTFDGRPHALAGDKQGATARGRRRGARALEFTETAGGKFLDARSYQVSRDGRTLILTRRNSGQSTPDRLVFARE